MIYVDKIGSQVLVENHCESEPLLGIDREPLAAHTNFEKGNVPLTDWSSLLGLQSASIGMGFARLAKLTLAPSGAVSSFPPW